MTFEEWWECNCDKACPSNAKDAARVLFEAGQNYEREDCAKVCDELKDNNEFPQGWGIVSEAISAQIKMRSNL